MIVELLASIGYLTLPSHFGCMLKYAKVNIFLPNGGDVIYMCNYIGLPILMVAFLCMRSSSPYMSDMLFGFVFNKVFNHTNQS